MKLLLTHKTKRLYVVTSLFSLITISVYAQTSTENTSGSVNSAFNQNVYLYSKNIKVSDLAQLNDSLFEKSNGMFYQKSNVNISNEEETKGQDTVPFLVPQNNTSALFLTDIKASASKNDALITWNVNDLVIGRVYFSTTSPLSITETTPWVSPSSYANYVNSKANIRRLQPNTTYYFKIYLKDFYGNTAISQELSFETK